MKSKRKSEFTPVEKDEKSSNISTDGYPFYAPADDLYNKNKEEPEIDPEDLSVNKQSNDTGKPDQPNEKDFEEEEDGSDLDVPGAELDDEAEVVGNEDEENNYYSLGGDDHNDLDEDNKQ
jgi:hypothetical protein